MPSMISFLTASSIPDASNFVSLETAPDFERREEFNLQGYRSDEFVRKDINVLTIGCSYAFGFALNIEARFCNVFCKSLQRLTGKSVANWNLALPSKSNDYVARMLLHAVPILNPDIVLVAFPRIGRREYFDIGGNCINYVIGGHRILEEQYASEFGAFAALASDNQDLLNFHMSYHMVQQVCKGRQLWFTFAVPPQDWDRMLQVTGKEAYVGPFEFLDTVDPRHPGALSNFDLAQRFLSKVKGFYGEKIF